jgi:hypothetical protein
MHECIRHPTFETDGALSFTWNRDDIPIDHLGRSARQPRPAIGMHAGISGDDRAPCRPGRSTKRAFGMSGDGHGESAKDVSTPLAIPVQVIRGLIVGVPQTGFALGCELFAIGGRSSSGHSSCSQERSSSGAGAGWCRPNDGRSPVAIASIDVDRRCVLAVTYLHGQLSIVGG